MMLQSSNKRVLGRIALPVPRKVISLLLLFTCLLLVVGTFIATRPHAAHAVQFPGTNGFSNEGFTNEGLQGQYYNNTDLSGTPVFTRTDVRINFNWPVNWSGSLVNAVSGSPSIPFPDTNFSVKWTGSIIPKYSETYTFTTVSDDGVRLFVNGQELINDWTYHGATTDTGTISLAAGQTYSIEMDYFQGGGQAIAQLLWSSPSTPQEIIEPATPVGINLDGVSDYSSDKLFADIMKTARNWNSNTSGQTVSLDANGWPQGDANVVLWDTSNMAGTYQLSFNGEASSVTLGANGYGASLSALSYDASQNLTTATMTVTGGSGNITMYFHDTQRTASSATNTGITNVKLMRPTDLGASTSYDPSTTFTNQAKNLLSHFTAIRFMDFLATNWNGQSNWSDRNTPEWYSQEVPQASNVSFGWEGPGGSWEYLVQLCNEVGKDAYINIPAQATDDYVTRVANLFKYGSDGVNPYTSSQTNPVFAPLNPNLRVYIEYTNEYWNFSFGQAGQIHDAAVNAVKNNTTNGQIISFDGNTDQWTDTQRYQALRIKQTSDDFRGVWGDSAMGSTIRVLYEWQYGGAWGDGGLSFLNQYFNNGDGKQHVSNPHPVNYFIWGGGGGWYDGVNNGQGTGVVTVQNNSFETPQLAAGTYQQNPSAPGWSFSGNAGIASNGSSVANGFTATDGTQFAYLQPGGSMSFTTTFPTDALAGLYFQSQETQTRGTSPALVITMDGTQITSYNQWYFSWDRAERGSQSFNVTAGTHTFTITNTDTVSTFYFDQVDVGTVDGMYNSGLGKIDSVIGDAKLCSVYRLYDVGYEGGFTIGGDTGTDLQYRANLDPRAQQFEVGSINNFFSDGGSLPMVFNSSGYSAYGVADPDIFSQNTPKLQGIIQAEQSLPAAATNLPAAAQIAASGSSTVTPSPDYRGNNFGRPNTGDEAFYLLNAAQAGTYSVSITTNGSGPDNGGMGQAFVMVNDQPLGGITNMPASSTISFGNVTLNAGLNTLRIYTVHGTSDPGYPGDTFHDQWQPSAITLTSA